MKDFKISDKTCFFHLWKKNCFLFFLLVQKGVLVIVHSVFLFEIPMKITFEYDAKRTKKSTRNKVHDFSRNDFLRKILCEKGIKTEAWIAWWRMRCSQRLLPYWINYRKKTVGTETHCGRTKILYTNLYKYAIVLRDVVWSIPTKQLPSHQCVCFVYILLICFVRSCGSAANEFSINVWDLFSVCDSQVSLIKTNLIKFDEN